MTDMPLAEAQAALSAEGFTMFDREATKGTSFDKEVVVCWPPLAEENAPTPLRAQGAIATLFVKSGTVDGRTVEALVRRWGKLSPLLQINGVEVVFDWRPV